MNESEIKERAISRFFNMKKLTEEMRLYAIDRNEAGVVFERITSLKRDLKRVSSGSYAQFVHEEAWEAEVSELNDLISKYEKKLADIHQAKRDAGEKWRSAARVLSKAGEILFAMGYLLAEDAFLYGNKAPY
jgi:hypothetical protein